MINGFEDLTYELSAEERDEILPILVKVLSARVHMSEAIKNREIVAKLKEIFGIKTSGSRIRKIINVIRIGGLVERLVACQKGYYVSSNDKDLERYQESLEQRAFAILEIAKQIEYQRKRKQNGNKRPD